MAAQVNSPGVSGTNIVISGDKVVDGRLSVVVVGDICAGRVVCVVDGGETVSVVLLELLCAVEVGRGACSLLQPQAPNNNALAIA